MPSPALVCCVLSVLPVFLQGPGPELRGRGRGGGAAGSETPETAPQPRTRKLPAASPQPEFPSDTRTSPRGPAGAQCPTPGPERVPGPGTLAALSLPRGRRRRPAWEPLPASGQLGPRPLSQLRVPPPFSSRPRENLSHTPSRQPAHRMGTPS